MTTYREKLIDRVIRIYGFEAEQTVAFAKLCENDQITDEQLTTIVENAEELPFIRPKAKPQDQEQEKSTISTFSKLFLQTAHYIGTISAGMFIGGMLSYELLNAEMFIGLALAIIVAVTSKIAYKERMGE